MIKQLLEEVPPQVTRGTRPMTIVSTMVFGVAMAVTAFAVWQEMGGLGWLGVWTLAVGLASIVAAVSLLAAPRLWRLVVMLLGVPVLVTICIGIAAAIDAALAPGAEGASPDAMTFGLVVGGLGVIWLTFVSRSLVRARRARIERVDPLPAQ